jgi:hypothetical protein
VFVWVDATQDATEDMTEDVSQDVSRDALAALLEAKDETIAALREQLGQANERDRENRRIIAALTSRIPPAIEPPSEPPGGPETAASPGPRESPFTDEERPQEGVEPQGTPRPWWRRMFGG